MLYCFKPKTIALKLTFYMLEKCKFQEMSICPDNVDIFYLEGRIIAIERKINYTELLPVEILLHIFSMSFVYTFF